MSKQNIGFDFVIFNLISTDSILRGGGGGGGGYQPIYFGSFNFELAVD